MLDLIVLTVFCIGVGTLLHRSYTSFMKSRHLLKGYAKGDDPVRDSDIDLSILKSLIFAAIAIAAAFRVMFVMGSCMP